MSSQNRNRNNGFSDNKQEVVSITYEEIGLFPRSFSRVLDRFLKQIFSDVENLVIQEYRFYRYLFLTTFKSLCLLFLVPFFVNFLAKNYVIRPLTEYFWNTKQTEIFLNSYQQKRAFAELKDFEEKLYFESLIYPKSAFHSVENPTGETGGSSGTSGTIQSGEGSLLGSFSPPLPAPQRGDWGGTGAKGAGAPGSPFQGVGNFSQSPNSPAFGRGQERGAGEGNTQPLTPLGPLAQGLSAESEKEKTTQAILTLTSVAENPLRQLSENPRNNYNISDGLNKSSVGGVPNSGTLEGANQVNPQGDTLGVNLTEKNSDLLLQGQNGAKPLDLNRSTSDEKTESLINSYTLKSSLFVYQTREADKNIQQRYQEKTIELAQRYNDQSIEAITNFFGDVVSLLTLFYLLYALEIQINITKSFLLEVFFGLDDSKKSLLILLVTDLLVGYHSSNLWELFFEFIFNHYGLPESQTGIFLLVATLPVLLDVLFKYLIFRHLNRSSPATVATYRAMIE